MKITEIKRNDLPIIVKLNENYKLEESVDIGTIMTIIDYKNEGDNCYKIYLKLLKKDMGYNKSIAERNWYDKNREPTLNYYEANIHKFDEDGNILDYFFIMGYDDCFDLISKEKPYFSRDEVIELQWNLFKKMHPIIMFNENCDIENIRNTDFKEYIKEIL